MNWTNSERLTVAIPTYNGQAYLESAIRSVLDQQGVPFTVVVCDDGSTDQTVDIARSFNDPRLRVMANDSRLGLTANWNRCVEQAHSEYLCLFHQDDVMQPGNLLRKVRMLDEEPAAGMVYSAVDVVDAQGNRVPETLVSRDSILTEDHVFPPGEFLTPLLARNVVRASTVMLRRSCLDQVGLFDASYRHVVDWEMWLRLASRFAVGWIAAPLVTVRWHQGSETHRQREQDTDLAEYRRLLDAAIQQYQGQLPQPGPVVRQAKRNLAEGYLNRAYLCLRVYQKPQRARDNLLAALRTSPPIAASLFYDPRFLLMAGGLLMAPRLTTRLLSRLRPGPQANEV